MTELTVGYVAGIVAFATVIAQHLFPTSITFILSGIVGDRETAGTWSVLARIIQSSHWPFLTQGDRNQSHGVSRPVRWSSFIIPALAILVSVAGVVTPLGLFEQDELSREITYREFQYVPDSGPFFQATSARSKEPFTRQCYFHGCSIPYLYSDGHAEVIDSSDNPFLVCNKPTGLNGTIPDVLRDIFSSGTKGHRTTVSNFFDIEWRQMNAYHGRSDGYVEMPKAGGTFRFLESLSQDNQIRVVEGLIVDSRNGGIGFRNHTVPVQPGRGLSWSEEILFLEPDVACVNTNLTVECEVTTNKDGSADIGISRMELVDNGGFVNHQKDTLIQRAAVTGVNKPDLQFRAFKAAWWANAMTMVALNVTDPPSGQKAFGRIDSKLGQRFRIPIPRLTSDVNSFRALQLNANFGAHIDIQPTSSGEAALENPFKINSTNFMVAARLCQGEQFSPSGDSIKGDSTPRLNSTYVLCQQVMGVPRRLDGGQELLFDHGSKWATPIYTCAAAARAIIKSVDFSYNGTGSSLDGLYASNISEKQYANDEDMPLWGLETWAEPFGIGGFDPLWGIVHPVFKDFPNISTIRAPYLYMLRSGWEYLQPGMMLRNIPGAIAPTAALRVLEFSSGLMQDWMPDINGIRSVTTWLKWKELSGSSDTMPQIIKLLWTDITASAVVGSKGVLGSHNTNPDMSAQIGVNQYYRRVRYRWLFGIPAYIVALCILVLLFSLLWTLILRRANIDIVRQRLKQVSTGRLLTMVDNPEESNFQMSPKEWSKANGTKKMHLAE